MNRRFIYELLMKENMDSHIHFRLQIFSRNVSKDSDMHIKLNLYGSPTI